MKLIVITESKDLENEHLIIRELFEEGLELLHIRKPDYSMEKMRSYISQIPQEFYNKVILHSHHSLAYKYKLKGIHFTENDRRSLTFPLKFIFSKLGNSMQLSTSYHKLGKLRNVNPVYSYVFLSPVFESISKQNHKPEFNLRKAYETLKTVKCKVIALGGVDHEKVSVCRDTGFHGVGLLGTIWLSKDPVGEFRKIKELCLSAQYSV